MPRLQVDENRVEWASTEQMIEFVRRGNDIEIYAETGDSEWDNDITISVPIGDFLHLLSELRKKFA